MSVPHTAETSLAGQPVEYETPRSVDAIEPRIDVDIGSVATVPPDELEPDSEQLLRENTNWVLYKRETYEVYREQAPERTVESGATFSYLGEEDELMCERMYGVSLAGVLRAGRRYSV